MQLRQFGLHYERCDFQGLAHQIQVPHLLAVEGSFSERILDTQNA
jgi:hypothetical protein